MKHTVRLVEDDDPEFEVEITVRATRREARQLARILRVSSEEDRLSEEERLMWRYFEKIIRRVVTSPKLWDRQDVVRPADEYGPSELDMDHVVRGNPPYPVLSAADTKTVWPLLEAKDLSLAEVAQRLYVDPRTVSRWRKREKEKNDPEKARRKR